MYVMYVILMFCMVRMVMSCSTGQISGSLADRLAEADSVIWGYVLAMEHDQNKSLNGLRVYSAEVRVKCVMKGEVTSRIKIVKLGDAPKRCVKVDLQLNQNYIMMLNKVVNSRTEYTADVRQDLFSRRRLDKVTGYCGLQLAQPINEAFTEQGYVDCSSFNRRTRRKRPCTTLPKIPEKNERTKKEKPTTTERRPHRTRVHDSQRDRPDKRVRRPLPTQRSQSVLTNQRKSSALTFKTQLELFFIVIAILCHFL